MEKIYLELGRKIKEKRVGLGLSQEELSSLSGVSSKFISDIERGVKKPSFATVYKLLSALDVDTSTFERDVTLPDNTSNSGDISPGTFQFFAGGTSYLNILPKKRNKDLKRWALLWKKLSRLPDRKREKMISIVEKLISSL